MSLQHRVLVVLRGALEPLTAEGVGHILGVSPMRVSAPISKLCSYGYLECAGMQQQANRQKRLYRFTGKAGQPYGTNP